MPPKSSASRSTRVQQVALITVGYSLGTDFKPGRRVALERVVRYERWR